MTVAIPRPRRWVALVVVVWLVVGLGGAAAYGLAYWFHRGFTPTSWPAGVAHGTTQHVRLHSAALGRDESYTVYLPPGYGPAARRGQRFPVLYLLHGSPGNSRLLLDVSGIRPVIDTLEHRRAIRPMILVAPSGSDGTFRDDTEWANSPHGNYGSAVIDVVRNVDARYATYADRGHRALAGISEGAYGAVDLLLRHLGVFSVAESWSGYYTQTAAGPFAAATRAQVAAASPLHYVGALAPQLARYPAHLLMYTGAHDHYLAKSAFLPFAAALGHAGGDVTARQFAGGHTWALWRRKTPYALRYLSWHFAAP